MGKYETVTLVHLVFFFTSNLFVTHTLDKKRWKSISLMSTQINIVYHARITEGINSTNIEIMI